MFNISARDRYLYGDPMGLALTAMTYGRMEHRHEPQTLATHRRPVVPWSGSAMMPASSVPLVREVTRKPKPKPVKPSRYSNEIAAMMRGRGRRLSEPKER